MAQTLSAQAAEQRASDSRVKQFAREMVRDHQSLQDVTDSIAAALHMTPVSPPIADSLKARQREVRDSVAAITGRDFDRAYILSQVRAHEQALSTFRQLADVAHNLALRALMNRAVRVVQEHLDSARAIAQQLEAAT